MNVRDEMIRFLEDELVGPRPGFPFVQLNGEEVLPPEDPPRLRYGAGILFPSKLLLDEQEDSSDIKRDMDSETNEKQEDQEPGDGITGETDPRADERGDSQPENDIEVNRANEFLPSALGITTHIRLPNKLKINIRAAQYKSNTIKGEGYKNKKGDWVDKSFWHRISLDDEIILDCKPMQEKTRYWAEHKLKTGNPDTKLSLHIFSRSVGVAIIRMIKRLLQLKSTG